MYIKIYSTVTCNEYNPNIRKYVATIVLIVTATSVCSKALQIESLRFNNYDNFSLNCVYLQLRV